MSGSGVLLSFPASYTPPAPQPSVPRPRLVPKTSFLIFPLVASQNGTSRFLEAILKDALGGGEAPGGTVMPPASRPLTPLVLVPNPAPEGTHGGFCGFPALPRLLF